MKTPSTFLTLALALTGASAFAADLSCAPGASGCAASAVAGENLDVYNAVADIGTKPQAATKRAPAETAAKASDSGRAASNSSTDLDADAKAKGSIAGLLLASGGAGPRANNGVSAFPTAAAPSQAANSGSRSETSVSAASPSNFTYISVRNAERKIGAIVSKSAEDLNK